MKQHYEAFSKNDANYVPLSPLSFVTRTADLFPDRTAIIYGDRRYSWAESYARMRQLASALDGVGLGLGDTVSVIAANTPEMFEAHYGVPMAGCVLNTINTRLEAETIAYILENSDCRLLIVDTAFHETVVTALHHWIPLQGIGSRSSISVTPRPVTCHISVIRIMSPSSELVIPPITGRCLLMNGRRLRLATHRVRRAARRALSIITAEPI